MSSTPNSNRPQFNLDLWPKPKALPASDPSVEDQVQKLLSQMSIEEKIGQMTQVEIHQVTDEEIRQYHIGSVLNAGGSTPDKDMTASVESWVVLADRFWEASTDDSDGKAGIPIIWGTDAVHGHNNVSGATIFPHNIGLGGIKDQQLIHDIYEATAREVAATGIDWVFSPTVTVVRDNRWGRTYEGYSDHSSIVTELGAVAVKALQGDFSENHVVACAKHFIGDGDTFEGVDQGNSVSSEEELASIHAEPYVAAIEAGVQTVMASFNSWHGDKLHGHQFLLTSVLKEHMGFDGFVISDWNGVGQVPGCSNSSCAKAINSGVDMIMVPYREDWVPFIENTIAQVNVGDIPMARIDDAVARILRVKIRSGLLEKPKPSQRKPALTPDIVGCKTHRDIAQRAVRESLWLLKNQNQVLPIHKGKNIGVFGNAAHDISRQSGGWSLSWQGCGITNEQFKGAKSVFAALDEHYENVTYYDDLSEINALTDLAIVVMGEEPYAEGLGDIGVNQTNEYSELYPQGLQLIQALKDKGIPTVVVFFSGRPLLVNKEINLADAFIVGWLPGSEGAGVVDGLLSDLPTPTSQVQASFSWPINLEQEGSREIDVQNASPLIQQGTSGLFNYDTPPVTEKLPEPEKDENAQKYQVDKPVKMFFANHVAPWRLLLNLNGEQQEVGFSEVHKDDFDMSPVDDGFGIQWGGRHIQSKDPFDLSISSSQENLTKLSIYLQEAKTELCFDIKVEKFKKAKAFISLNDEKNELSEQLEEFEGKGWKTCRTAVDQFTVYSIASAFKLEFEGDIDISIANISWLPAV